MCPMSAICLCLGIFVATLADNCSCVLYPQRNLRTKFCRHIDSLFFFCRLGDKLLLTYCLLLGNYSINSSRHIARLTLSC